LSRARRGRNDEALIRGTDSFAGKKTRIKKEGKRRERTHKTTYDHDAQLNYCTAVLLRSA